jgi:NAD(P)-dependent dehydrogenase (short-subunit alcohol dehydrogenase family)
MESTQPLALVTGASSGIGFELARQFAHHGFDVIVAAEDPDIGTAAAELGAEAVQVDLATEDGVERLWRGIGGRAPPSGPAGRSGTRSCATS